MRHSIFVSIVVVLFVSILTGCPQAPVAPQDNTIDVSGQQPLLPGEKSGGLLFDMKLYENAKSNSGFQALPPLNQEAKGGEEILLAHLLNEEWQAIVDKQVHRIARVTATLSGPDSGIVLYTFDLKVSDGAVHQTVQGIRPGSYALGARFYSAYGDYLFQSSSNIVQIVADANASCTLDAYLVNYCNYTFVLPQSGWSGGVAAFVDNNGHEWSLFNTSVSDAGIKIFAALPYNILQPLTLYLYDIDFNGPVVAGIEFDPLAGIDNEIVIATNGDGTIDIDVNFHQPIGTLTGIHARQVGSGQDYQSFLTLQDAVDRTQNPVEVLLGLGSFQGFVLSAGKSVSITGLGPDKTKIFDNNPSHGYTIWASYWAPVTHVDPSEGDGYGKSVPEEAKGGGWSLMLNNLAIDNSAATPKPKSWYSDAAVVCEMGIGLVMNNCAVFSSNRCITTNYDNFVYIDHCVLSGLPSANVPGWEADDASDEVKISNSIVMNCGVALQWNGAPVTHDNCVFWGNTALAYGPGGSPFDIQLLVDPMVDTISWHLYPGSPCLGAATDGGDIGIDWRN